MGAGGGGARDAGRGELQAPPSALLSAGLSRLSSHPLTDTLSFASPPPRQLARVLSLGHPIRLSLSDRIRAAGVACHVPGTTLSGRAAVSSGSRSIGSKVPVIPYDAPIACLSFLWLSGF